MFIQEILFIIRQQVSRLIINPLDALNRIDLSIVFEGVYHQKLIGLLPVIGYALAFVSLGDYLYIIFPLQLQDPVWELQTIAALVEQSWGFLIALALIFSRYFTDNQDDVRAIELWLLKFIRWLVLAMAIIFILSTPLIVSDTSRLYRSINQQFSQEDRRKLDQIANVYTKVDQVSDLNQIIALGRSIGLDPATFKNTPFVEIKKEVKTRLTAIKANIENQAQAIQKAQSKKLIKNSFRTLYSGLVISFTFIFIWFKIGTLGDRL